MTRRSPLSAGFHDVVSAITRPDVIAPTSRYFYQRWAHRLGPTAVAVLQALRRRCYFNPRTGENRDVCFPLVEDLAAEVGVRDRKTIMRALAVLERHGFLLRQRRYRNNPASLGVSRLPDAYRVAMTDPLAPEDEGRAAALEAQRIADGAAASAAIPHRYVERTDGVENRGRAVDNFRASAPHQSLFGTDSSVPISDRAVPLQEPLYTNVQTFGGAHQGGESRVQQLVLDCEAALSDSRSRGFLVLCCARLPEDVIREALSEVRLAAAEGRLRTNAGAYFVGIMKRRAEELGVSLAGRSNPRGSKCS